MRVANHSPDIEEKDFEEAPRLPRPSWQRSFGVAVLSVIMVVGFSVFMIRGSMPDMFPEEIVQLEGYQGRQQPRSMFNLESIASGDTTPNHTAMPEATDNPADAKLAQDEQKAGENGTSSEVLASAKQKPEMLRVAASKAASSPIADEGAVQGDSDEVDIPVLQKQMPATDGVEVRIPALEPADFNQFGGPRLGPGKGDETSEKTASNELVTVPIPGWQVDAPEPASGVPVSIETYFPNLGRASAEAGVVDLPIYKVIKPRTNIRTGPSLKSEVITMLSLGTTVSVFDRDGEWAQVGVNDGSSRAGFIHVSLLEEVAK